MSSHDQGAELERLVAQLTGWAAGRGLVVAEWGAGPTCAWVAGARVGQGFVGPVCDGGEHRDRLTRFGVRRLEAALAGLGRRVLVADPGEGTGDLVREVMEVLTSMCARLYGCRGGRNRASRARDGCGEPGR